MCSMLRTRFRFCCVATALFSSLTGEWCCISFRRCCENSAVCLLRSLRSDFFLAGSFGIGHPVRPRHAGAVAHAATSIRSSPIHHALANARKRSPTDSKLARTHTPAHPPANRNTGEGPLYHTGGSGRSRGGDGAVRHAAGLAAQGPPGHSAASAHTLPPRSQEEGNRRPRCVCVYVCG